jgi:SAM-dependent methyltransferase
LSPRSPITAQAREWDELAALDPFWAVLSEPEFSGDQGEQLRRFFETGEGEVSGSLDIGRELGLPERFERALDFGCGLGRLTRALGSRFESCVGVDISARMLDAARRLNANVPNCEFWLNADPDLRAFPEASFDLVYSSIVLQHLRSAAEVERFVAEFVRLARPGGLIVFQLPAAISLRYRLQPRRRAYALLRALGVDAAPLYRHGLNPIRVLALPEARVREVVVAHGGDVRRVLDDRSVPQLPGRRYFATVAPR